MPLFCNATNRQKPGDCGRPGFCPFCIYELKRRGCFIYYYYSVPALGSLLIALSHMVWEILC